MSNEKLDTEKLKEALDMIHAAHVIIERETEKYAYAQNDAENDDWERFWTLDEIQGYTLDARIVLGGLLEDEEERRRQKKEGK